MTLLQGTVEVRDFFKKRHKKNQDIGITSMTPRVSTLLKIFGILAMVAGLSACREAEENRPIKLEKGSYAGPKDTQLSEEQRRELRARGNKQSF